jgi:hypothetical protein
MYQHEVFSESLFSLESDPWGNTLTDACFPISSLNNSCDNPIEDAFQIDFPEIPSQPALPEVPSLPALPEVPPTLPAPMQIPQPLPQPVPQPVPQQCQFVAFNQPLLPYKEPIYAPPISYQSYYPPMPQQPAYEGKKSTVCLQLTQDFDYFYLPSAPTFRTVPRLALDVSKTFSAPKYSEIFYQHATRLLVDKHPQLTESDLKQIEQTGFLYFMKNVKLIVPKIGPWRFLSHVRSGGSNDRSYNLIGFPIRCKVKEWVIGADLWRMYHFVKGKTSKARQLQ